MKLTTHRHLALRLRNRGAFLQCLLYAFIFWLSDGGGGGCTINFCFYKNTLILSTHLINQLINHLAN
jgi:hypothetical protein